MPQKVEYTFSQTSHRIIKQRLKWYFKWLTLLIVSYISRACMLVISSFNIVCNWILLVLFRCMRDNTSNLTNNVSCLSWYIKKLLYYIIKNIIQDGIIKSYINKNEYYKFKIAFLKIVLLQMNNARWHFMRLYFMYLILQWPFVI